jgi:hypothetical protein
MSSSANNVSIVDASVATALIAPDPSRKSTKEDNINNNNNNNDNDSKNAAATTTAGGTGTVEESKKEKSSSVVVSADERFYAVDPTRLQTLRDEKPWTKVAEPDPSTTASSSASSSSNRPVAKFFESISLSPSAVTKIMMHCQSGVEKGVAQGGNPIEGTSLLNQLFVFFSPHTYRATMRYFESYKYSMNNIQYHCRRRDGKVPYGTVDRFDSIWFILQINHDRIPT